MEERVQDVGGDKVVHYLDNAPPASRAVGSDLIALAPGGCLNAEQCAARQPGRQHWCLFSFRWAGCDRVREVKDKVASFERYGHTSTGPPPLPRKTVGTLPAAVGRFGRPGRKVNVVERCCALVWQ